MELVIRRYTVRLYPNATQRKALERLRVMSCWLYNALIEQRRDCNDRRVTKDGRRVYLSSFDQQKECTLLVNDDECLEWKGFPVRIRQRVCDRVEQAYKKYFDNVKAWKRGQWSKPFPPQPPRYQKSSEFSGFGLKGSGNGWKWLGNGRISIKDVGDVKCRGRFPCESVQIRTADVTLRDGKWEMSIVVKLLKSGRMSRPTLPFSNEKASNSLSNTLGCISIRSSAPPIEGEPQGPRRERAVLCRSSAPQIGPSRGKKNRQRRQRNAIARRDHAIHEYTSWLAAHGGDIEVIRPPLREATRSGRGTVKEHGALVAYKARANRELLDRGIGKFCETLAYKVETHGNAFTVTDKFDHDAMIPEAAASTAKLAKKVTRIVRRKSRKLKDAA